MFSASGLRASACSSDSRMRVKVMFEQRVVGVVGLDAAGSRIRVPKFWLRGTWACLGHESGDTRGQQRYRAVSRDLRLISAKAQKQPCSSGRAVYGMQEVRGSRPSASHHNTTGRGPSRCPLSAMVRQGWKGGQRRRKHGRQPARAQLRDPLLSITCRSCSSTQHLAAGPCILRTGSRRREWCSKAAGLDGPRPPRGS
jgi:hypothetical protein